MYDEMNKGLYGTEGSASGHYDTSSSYTHYDSSSVRNQEPPKKKGGFFKTLVKCAVLAVVFGGVAAGSFMGVNYLGHQYFGDAVSADLADSRDSNGQSEVANTTVSNKKSDVYDVSDIVENCMPSVVSITNIGTTEFRTFFGTYEQQSQSSGSGIIIGKNDDELLIVTNNHVISGAKELSVYFNSDGEAADEENVISAKTKGTDASKDLAVISVKLSDLSDEIMSKIKVATIGDSKNLKVGEPVVAIGNAYGYGLSVTSGIVSALNREVAVNADGMTIKNKLIQVDAAINPGNSGGALLDSRGELIGINSVKFVSEDVEGMGYAIPISDVESIIGDLMNKVTRDKVEEASRGYLGVTCVDVTEDASQNYGMPIGVYIRSVVENSGADKAGLQNGDIITKLDGSSVTGFAQLQDQLQYYSAGETIPVTIQRVEGSGYVEKVIDVTLSTSLQAQVKGNQKNNK